MTKHSFSKSSTWGKAVFLGAFLGLATLTPAVAQDATEAIADAIGIPQMDAFLPDKYSVEKIEALPIDGVWMISSIRKKIRIEQGRAYAIDSWLHLFTLKVQRDMVVLQNFERTGTGQYRADDLPLLGPATMRLTEDGNLSVSVAGMLGPVNYRLIRREVDDETKFQRELNRLSGRSTDPEPDDRISNEDDTDPLADCENLDVDLESGDVICAD